MFKEQIAKLANESGFDVDKTGTFGNYSEMHRLEKFAELLVKECMSKALQGQLTNMNGNQIAYIIKEHFGVEE